MALGKMLNLGGIDNRPPKANQSMGRFRVARNVYPTPDGRLIPRYDWEAPASQPLRVRAYHHITQYDGDALSVVSRDHFNIGAGNEIYQIYRNTTLVPGSPEISPFQEITQDTNNSTQTYRKNNTTYFLLPEYSGNNATLSKYDGVQVWNMGVQQPKIGSVAADGTTYIRCVQHTIDFDNNESFSEYVEFNAAAGATTTVEGAGDFGTNMITSGKATAPENVIQVSGKQPIYYRGTSAYNAGTLDYTITTTDTNITSINIGEYLMVDWAVTGLNLAAAGFQGYGLALKVKSVSPLTLDATDSKYLNLNREWVDYAPALTLLGAGLTIGTQTFISFWRSASQTGIYYFGTFAPSFPFSAVTFPIAADISPTTSAEITYGDNIVTLGPALNSIYDVTTKKLSPNSIYPFGLNHNLYCMTNFQDLMLLASDDLIWISDPTLGGNYETLNASTFIRVGDTEYGRITSICGTQDFLVVCRERKNYYVTGNIVTGNYRVQEIIEAEIGAWSNVASINVKDSVIFLTAIGVFQVVAGGKATKLSETCPKNFETYDPNSINEDVSFRMEGFVSDITNTTIDGLSVGYDEYRELLVFMQKGIENNPCFVLHTKTGEFYEWDGFMANSPDIYANCIGFIQAEYYVGQVDDNVSYNGSYVVENSSLIPTYPTSNPIKLYSTWLTAGEPSLEKELLQLKLFGRIQSNGTTSSIKVANYKDWDISTKITDVEYFPSNTALSISNQIQYSHKKRLNSDKVLAASVGIEVTTTNVLFEIESFEVEFNPIQSGMKR